MVPLRVDAAALEALLTRLGETELLADLLRKWQAGHLTFSERDGAIIGILMSHEYSVSLEDLGRCFMITRERVSQIAEAGGIKEKNYCSRFPQWKERAHFLARDQQGRKLVYRVMGKVAREERFWAFNLLRKKRGGLRRKPVLQELGFQNIGHARLWRMVIKEGAVSEENLVGIVLLYVLGEDPAEFIQQYYFEDDSATLKSVAAEIDCRARPFGCLSIHRTSLRSYFLAKGWRPKTKGSRNPFWLHKRGGRH